MAGGGADGKVKKRTLANITHWVPAKIEALRRLLRDEAPSGERAARLKLLRSLPHGHVAAALGLLRKVGLDHVLPSGGRQPGREAALCIANGGAVDRSGVQAGHRASARRRDGDLFARRGARARRGRRAGAL